MAGAPDRPPGEDPGGPAGFGGLARASVIFVLGAVAGKAVGLVLLPILTRALTPDGLGETDVLLSLGSALTAALTLGLDVALVRLWFDRSSPVARRSLVATSYAITIAVAAVASLVIIVFARQLTDYLFGDADLLLGVVLLPVIIAAGVVITINQTVLRAQEQAGRFAIVNGGTVVLYAALAMLLLATWRPDGNAVLVAWAVSLLLFALVGLAMVRRSALGRPTPGDGRELLRLGLPLAPAVAAAVVGEFVNRMILLEAAGPAQVAYFTIAGRFSAAAGLAVAGFQLAWQPRAFAAGSSSDARLRIAADSRWIIGIVCALVVAIAVVSPEVVPLVTGSGYAGALPALGFSLVAVIGTALYLVAGLPSAIAKATQDLGFASAVAVLAAVAFNLVLVGPWGAVGTAAAVAAGQLAAVAIVARLGARRMPLPFDWPWLAGVSAISSVVVLASLVLGAGLAARLFLGCATVTLIARTLSPRMLVRQAAEGLRHRLSRTRRSSSRTGQP